MPLERNEAAWQVISKKTARRRQNDSLESAMEIKSIWCTTRSSNSRRRFATRLPPGVDFSVTNSTALSSQCKLNTRSPESLTLRSMPSQNPTITIAPVLRPGRAGHRDQIFCAEFMPDSSCLHARGVILPPVSRTGERTRSSEDVVSRVRGARSFGGACHGRFQFVGFHAGMWIHVLREIFTRAQRDTGRPPRQPEGTKLRAALVL